MKEGGGRRAPLFSFCVCVVVVIIHSKPHRRWDRDFSPRVWMWDGISRCDRDRSRELHTSWADKRDESAEPNCRKHLLPQVEKSLKPQKRRRLKSASALQLLPAFALTAKREYRQVKLQLYSITKNVIQDSCWRLDTLKEQETQDTFKRINQTLNVTPPSGSHLHDMYHSTVSGHLQWTALAGKKLTGSLSERPTTEHLVRLYIKVLLISVSK